MLSLKDFKNRMNQEEILINDSIKKITGGTKSSSYEVSYFACGCPKDSGESTLDELGTFSGANGPR